MRNKSLLYPLYWLLLTAAVSSTMPATARPVKTSMKRAAPRTSIGASQQLGPDEGPLRVGVPAQPGNRTLRWFDRQDATGNHVIFGDTLPSDAKAGRTRPRLLVFGKRDKATLSAWPILGAHRDEGNITLPTVSPDGCYATFFDGLAGSAYATLDLWLIDLKSKKLVKIDTSLDHGPIAWSRDSRYLAWGHADHTSVNTPALLAYDIASGKKRPVARDKFAASCFAWGALDSLYFSAVSGSADARRTGVKSASPVSKQARPSLYALRDFSGKSGLIVRDALFPRVSPDGTRIAYFGSEDLHKPYPLCDDWRLKANGTALNVIRSDGTGRKVLNREHGEYPVLVWSDDNASLFSLESTYERDTVAPQLLDKGALPPDVLYDPPEAPTNPTKFGAVHQGTIGRWDIASGHWKKIADAVARDCEYNGQVQGLFPAFNLSAVTGNGALLHWQKREIVWVWSIYTFRYTNMVTDLKTGHADQTSTMYAAGDLAPQWYSGGPRDEHSVLPKG